MAAIDLPYLETRRGRSRWYCYYRRDGRRTPIKDSQGKPLGPEDAGLYAAWRILHDAHEAGIATGTRPGTLGHLIEGYLSSAEYAGLADSTRRYYRRTLDWMRPAGQMPLSLLDVAAVVKMRDKAAAAHGWRFSSGTITMVSILWGWGLLHGHCTGDNPTRPVPPLPRPKTLGEANRPWRPDEVAAVMAAVSPGLRAAVALGVYAGMRLGDVLRLPWSAIGAGWIVWRQGKTGGQVELPLHPALARILDETPRVSPVIVTGPRGTPLTESGFRSAFFGAVRRLEANGTIGDGLTFHGLRHTAGTMLAEAGATQHQIQHWLGHATAAMTARYTTRVDARRLTQAAMALLEQGKNTGCQPPLPTVSQDD